MTREIVIPGEKLIDKAVRIEGTRIENGATYATVLGLFEKESERIIPLEGMWTPKADDLVVGVIDEVGRNNTYRLQLTDYRDGLLMLGKFAREGSGFKKGDVIEAQVDRIENKKKVILSRPRLLKGGTVIMVKPTKIPRIIGKSDTMIKQIAELTNTDIVAGTNGTIWLNGGDVALATEAILRIEREAHLQGLTEKIKEMLKKK